MWVRWDNLIGRVVSIHYRPPVSNREEMWVLLVAGAKTDDKSHTVRLYSLDYNDIDEVVDPPLGGAESAESVPLSAVM